MRPGNVAAQSGTLANLLGGENRFPGDDDFG
jgi:hypothetical protein